MTKHFIGLCGAIAGLATDQASKAFVVANSDTFAAGIPVFPGFNLVYHRNYGVTFGFFQNVPWWALALVAAAIVLFLLISMIRAEKKLEALAYGMVIGGALGNILDRFRFGGVTDFLDFYIKTTHWPAFNLADVFVVCGVALLLLVTSGKKTEPAQKS